MLSMIDWFGALDAFGKVLALELLVLGLLGTYGAFKVLLGDGVVRNVWWWAFWAVMTCTIATQAVAIAYEGAPTITAALALFQRQILAGQGYEILLIATAISGVAIIVLATLLGETSLGQTPLPLKLFYDPRLSDGQALASKGLIDTLKQATKSPILVNNAEMLTARKTLRLEVDTKYGETYSAAVNLYVSVRNYEFLVGEEANLLEKSKGHDMSLYVRSVSRWTGYHFWNYPDPAVRVGNRVAVIGSLLTFGLEKLF